MATEAARNKALYFARLAEQAERYDEMAEHMKEARQLSTGEITEEEQRLISVAYSNTVSARKAAWRNISDAAKDASNSGDEHLAELAFKYRAKVEDELNSICVLTRDDLIPRQQRTDNEAVFYQKMKADTYRHAAELGDKSVHGKAAETAAQEAFEEASALARSALPPAHPLQFGLALSHSVFQSEVLRNPKEACRTAPSALRHFPSSGSSSPRGSVPSGVVAQRLCDLLLEFPEAAIGGVHWSTLLSAYAELYNEVLDLAQLGHETPSAAAHALLADVLRHQRTGQALGQVMEDQGDLLVAVDDTVALTPLPGFAGSWPALYKTLCALVLGCGAQDAGDTVEGRPSGQVLLLSQLRPLLDSAKEDGAQQKSTTSGALQARSLLLSQLRPVSKLCKECSAESGLSFRDDHGGLKKLQKLGHVVKAVLQWRDQRLLWRRTLAAKPSAVDEALLPTLELVFSKRLNNLVLYLYNAVEGDDTFDHKDASASPTIAETASKDKQHPSTPPSQRTTDASENPFKWQPLCQSSDPRISAAARPTFSSRCCSSPPMSAGSTDTGPSSAPNAATLSGSDLGSSPPLGSPPSHFAYNCEKRCKELDADNHQERYKRWASPIRPVSLHAFPRRSSSRGARSPSCPARTRSPVNGRDNLCRDGAEMRSTSEPPRQCWADIVDDPDEPPLWNMFLQSPPCLRPSPEMAAKDPSCAAAESIRNCESADAPHEVVLEPVDTGRADRLKRWTSPVCLERASGEIQRTPSCGARASSCSTRARSLTRACRGDMRHSSAASSQESFGLRCTSEPAHGRMLDVFDDPFEPPPQDMQWGAWSMISASDLVFGCSHSGKEELHADSPPPSIQQVPLSQEPISGVQGLVAWTTKRWASPKRVDVSNVESGQHYAARAPRSSSRSVRARSLTRSHGGAMRREATWSARFSERLEPRSEHVDPHNPVSGQDMEPRCTSEPPQGYCWSDVYDDPFEPPPQETWRSRFPEVAPVKPNTLPSNREPRDCSNGYAVTSDTPSAMPVAPEGQQLQDRVLPWLVSGQLDGEYMVGTQSRARSLTRVSRSEAQQSPSLMRRVETACLRCTSEPPQLRAFSVFDDPFEPPPQEMWWSTPAPVQAH